MERFQKSSLARQVIEEIMYRYSYYVDTADIESLGTIFAAGALISQNGQEVRGPKAVAELFSNEIIFYDQDGKKVPYVRNQCTPLTRHVTTNIMMDFNNQITVAGVKSYFTVYQTIEGKNPIIAGGRYEDRFEHDPYGWHLIERRILLDNLGDMSHHLKSAGSSK